MKNSKVRIMIECERFEEYKFWTVRFNGNRLLQHDLFFEMVDLMDRCLIKDIHKEFMCPAHSMYGFKWNNRSELIAWGNNKENDVVGVYNKFLSHLSVNEGCFVEWHNIEDNGFVVVVTVEQRDLQWRGEDGSVWVIGDDGKEKRV